MLDLLELIQLKVGIHYGKHVTVSDVLIQKNALPTLVDLRLDLQNPLTLQHDRQDVSDSGMLRFVGLAEPPKHAFDILPEYRLGRRRGRHVENPLPEGNKTFAIHCTLAVLAGPTF
jgi:hypothetical protein